MATRRWLGRAVAIAEVYTITIADTWATDDTATLTINGKQLTLTVGTDTTTDEVATAIKEMVNGDSQTGTGDHSFSQTGNNIGEFARVTATVSGSVVTLTGDDAGVPFTLTASESTVGTGTATAANPIDATGPNHFDNADNWSGDTVPIDGDDIVFDSGDSDCRYGIDTSIQPASLVITQGYTGRIGLAKTNEDEPTLPYDEYRDEYLKLANDAGTPNTAIEIGSGSGNGSGRIKIDLDDAGNCTINVFNTGQREETEVPAILLKGTDADTVLNLNRGDVGVAFFDGESGHLATVRVGYIDNQAGDSQLIVGSGVDLTDAALSISGGTVQIDATTSSGTIDMYEGELTILSGPHADIDIDGGTCFYRSTGTATTIRVGGGGVLNFTRDINSRTVTNCELYSGGIVLDPFKTVTWTNGVDVTRAGLAEVTLDLGVHLTLTPSVI